MASSKKADKGPVTKAPSRDGQREMRQHKGKLIYHSVEQSKKRVGDNPHDIVEKSVTHSDENLFCKYYEKKNGVVTKITVKSGGAGKEYTLTIKRGDAPGEITTHTKKEILAKLSKDDRLSFMVKYLEGTAALSRALKRSSRTMSRSRSRSRKSGSRSRKSRSRSRSISRSRSRRSLSRSRSRSKSRRRSKRTKRSLSRSRSRSRRSRKSRRSLSRSRSRSRRGSKKGAKKGSRRGSKRR